MTSIQLAQRLARNLTITDITRMPAGMLLDVLEAINSSLQWVFAHLPDNQRKTTFSETLLAPATVAVQFPARYSNILIGTPFMATQRGCTVVLNDDSQNNEVAAPNAVLDQFLGQSLSGNAIVYGDCVPIFQVIERLASPVRLYDPNSYSLMRELVYEERRRTRFYANQIGVPRTYSLESVGAVEGTEPTFYLRVHPMPAADIRIRFEAILATIRVTFANICQTAVNLPVPDNLCESSLIPIAESKLTRSSFWADPATKQATLGEQERAFQMLGLVPQVAVPEFNTCGTPRGF